MPRIEYYGAEYDEADDALTGNQYGVQVGQGTHVDQLAAVELTLVQI